MRAHHAPTHARTPTLGGDAPLLVLFIVATIENDAPPEAAGRCVRFFSRAEHPKEMLANLHFAVLGLGGAPGAHLPPASYKSSLWLPPSACEP